MLGGTGRLHIPGSEARRYGPGNVFAVCWRQWRAERALARRGVRFRSTDPGQVARAYAAMSGDEFEAVNGPQEWANWRTIPAALSGRLPDRPLKVFDLGCGTGTSTRVLARVCPPGSEIVGYELAGPLLEQAERRAYRHRTGVRVPVRFVCQPVTETWRLPNGAAVPDGSADLVNASGLVGHHLDPRSARPLRDELRRVVRDGGLVLLDDGPTLPRRELVRLMRGAGFEPLDRVRSCWLAPTGQVIFRKGPD